MNRLQSTITGGDVRYREDCERIVRISMMHGYNITLGQAEQVWDDYSDSMAAGWMNLPESDEEVWEVLSEEA